MPGGWARGQNLVHFQNEVFNLYLDNHLSKSIQKAFRLGPEVQCRVSFHSMISDPRVHARGWGQNLVQYNLSNPACYQTEKKIRIRQGAGIARLTYPRDIKVTLVSIGIQHTADNG